LKKKLGLFFAGFPCCPVTGTAIVSIYTVAHPEIIPTGFGQKIIGENF